MVDELLVGFELAPVPRNVDTRLLRLHLGNQKCESRLIVLPQGIDVIAEPLSQLPSLPDIYGLVLLREEIDARHVRDRAVRTDWDSLCRKEELEKLRKISTYLVEDLYPWLMNLNGDDCPPEQQLVVVSSA
jgi:hypothetical protein